MRLPSGLRGNLILALASALLTLVLFVLGYEAWQSAKYRAWRARYDNKGWLGTLTVPSSDPVLMWEYRPHREPPGNRDEPLRLPRARLRLAAKTRRASFASPSSATP